MGDRDGRPPHVEALLLIISTLIHGTMYSYVRYVRSPSSLNPREGRVTSSSEPLVAILADCELR